MQDMDNSIYNNFTKINKYLRYKVYRWRWVDKINKVNQEYRLLFCLCGDLCEEESDRKTLIRLGNTKHTLITRNPWLASNGYVFHRVHFCFNRTGDFYKTPALYFAKLNIKSKKICLSYRKKKYN